MALDEHPYVMSIDLNVIKHLGIGLYNSNPVVVAEAVANSWDANAKSVEITVGKDGKSVIIEDDGHGMTRDQVNTRFLNIGYERRKSQGEKTEGNLRLAMGRKGIGKLSLFAISDDIYVYTKRKDEPVEAFRLNSKAIAEQVTDQNSAYYPEKIDPIWDAEKESGTKIVLRSLKRDLIGSSRYLRERLARRFSVIGQSNSFSVSVDGDAIGVGDRGYLRHLEYVWHLGPKGIEAKDQANAKKTVELKSDKIEGWIGTVAKPSQLKDQGNPSAQSANGIVVMIRGRVAHENILDSIGEAGIYAQYVVGELHADYLDPEDGSVEDDLITSSRQLLREDDIRVQELREHIRLKLKEVERDWTSFRNEKGVDEARNLPSIDEWFESLDRDAKQQATKLFGKINAIRFKDDDDDERADLFRYAVIAFEKMRARKSLSDLDRVSTRDVQGFLKAFQEIDEVEAALYHETVQGRVELIRSYQKLVDDNALEKTLQEELFKHLWLLDPSWDRATGVTEMELAVTSFLKTDKGLCSKEIEGARMDIVYRELGGTHVVIEMKRPKVPARVYRLLEQVDKYHSGLKAHLAQKYQRPNPFIQVIILVDEEPDTWVDEDRRAKDQRQLDTADARILTYNSMLQKALATYQQFLVHDASVARLSGLLSRIQDEIAAQSNKAAAE
jgi:hypothetical protein